MNGEQLVQSIRRTMVEIKQYSDELRDLDTALGDGDLGITVSLGADAIIDALDNAEPDALPAETARTCAKAFANANPSTMAALVAGALLSGSRIWGEQTTVNATDAAAFAQAAGESISKRGKSEIGDKTILDALVPAGRELSTDDGLVKAIAAAQRAVEETTPLQSRRGRASWLQERSIGLQDPGATALLRFLESWQNANPTE